MDRLCVVTKCRSCGKVSTREMPYPVTGAEFPMECSGCGMCQETPLREGELDKVEAAFEANLALARSGSGR